MSDRIEEKNVQESSAESVVRLSAHQASIAFLSQLLATRDQTIAELKGLLQDVYDLINRNTCEPCEICHGLNSRILSTLNTKPGTKAAVTAGLRTNR